MQISYLTSIRYSNNKYKPNNYFLLAENMNTQKETITVQSVRNLEKLASLYKSVFQLLKRLKIVRQEELQLYYFNKHAHFKHN